MSTPTAASARVPGDAAAAVRDAGYAAGPVAALEKLAQCVAENALVCGPTGWSLVAPAELERIDQIVVDERRYRRHDVDLTVRESLCLAAEGLVAVHVRPRDDAPSASAAGTGAELAWLAGHLRLGLLRRLREAAHEHLRGRSAGDLSLLQHQMVKHLFAEAALDVLLAEQQLAVPRPAPASAARAHLRLTRAGRTLLRLLGASGFLLDGPGAAALVSEVVGNAVVAGSPPVSAWDEEV